MDDLMDDIFGESTTPTEEQGKKKPDSHRERRESDVDDLFNLSVAPEKSSTTQSSRRDSELDDLFSSIGLNDDSAPPKRNASSDSLDDVDAFISNLTGSSPPHSGAETSELNLGHIEKDDFLSWLEEPENSKPQQGQENLSTPAGPINTKGDRESEKSTQREVEEEYEEEEEEEEDHFYIDHTGTTVIQDEQAGQESESSAMDDQQPREQVQELTLPFPVLRPVTDGVSEAIVPRSLQQLQATDAECTGQNISASVEKVSVRVETLFEIEQFDVQALRSASYFKDVAGFVVPPQLRPDMWSAITRNSRLEQQLVPDWFQVPEERLAEVFPSIRKTIRKDCRDAWAALSSQTEVSLEDDTVNQLHILVSKLVLRHREKTYNILLTNVASVVVWMVSRSVKESTEQVFSTSAKLIESVCAKWGGRSGDWSFMGLRKDSIAIGVGGAAWTNETLPLVAFRRHLILSKLVAFHDAALGYHLESFCKNWSCSELTVFLEDDATPPPMLDPESNEPQATVFQRRVVDRVIEMATKTPRWPSGKLFGPLSPVPATGTLTDLNGEHLLALWDAVFFSGRTPQTMAFFFALASLLLTRNNLLQTRESAAISRHIENAYQGSVLQADSTRPASSLAALAVSLVSNTPDCLLNWISEEELLLPLASEEQLADFEAMRRRAKDAEREILRVLADKEKAESVQQRNDPPKEQPEEGSDEKVEFEAPVDDADHPQQQQPQPRTAQATSSAQQSRTSWFSSALKKRAQTIKSAILTASGTNTIDWSKFHLVRKLVEFGGSEEEPLGLSMRKGKYGLEVEAVVPGGVTERTQLVSSGDLVMTLNGLLVFGLSGAEVEALLSQQERPFYMVFGTLLPKDVPLGSEIESLLHAPTLCPGLLERVEAYYTVYNKGKEKEVERILSLYSHREAVLLEELALKYMDHVEGDPFYFPQSLFCPPMDPHEVVRQVCFKEEEHSPNAEHYRAHRQGTSAWSTSHKQTSSEAPRKLFLVDCRPAKTVEKTGRFPTCYTLDPVLLDDEEERKKLHQVFEPMRGDMQICILGSGSDTLLSDINPKRSRVLRERDRRGIDTVALYFLRLGFPFVSYVEGGFLGCFLAIREMEYSLDDCLVNMPPSRQFLAKYDAFIRYRKSSSSSAAAFLASKARSGMTKPRTETAASFSGLLASGDDESGSRTKNLAAIGSYLSNVWKQPQSQSQPQSMHHAVEHHQEQQTEQPKQTTSDPSSGGGETMNKASAFFSSVWKKTSAAKAPEKEGGGEETTSASQDEDGSSTTLRKHDSTDSTGQGGTSWTSSLSSRFKSLKVPDTANLGSKLRTAYVSAQQKLATVSTTDGAPSSVTSASYSLDLDETPEILAKIGSLQKGEKVHLRELEQSIRAFQVQKEKPDIQNDKETEIKTVPRLLVISPERFLVLEPVEGVENEGVVKSNRPLRDVARMRYPNNDPSKISLFYNKSPGSDQVSYIYRFPTEAKTFTKSIMHACAKNNSKRAAQQENT